MSNFLKRHPHLTRSIWRRIHQHTNAFAYTTIHVNEFPKSGGSWLCRLISESSDLRFDDNRYPAYGPAVIKHHRKAFTLKPTITVVRDPRDVAVSFYHHSRKVFDDDGFNTGIVKLMQEYVYEPGMNESEKLEAFVHTITQKPIQPAFTWGDFYRHPDRNGTYIIRYEDIRKNPVESIDKLFNHLNYQVEVSRIESAVNANDINKILKSRENNDKSYFIRKGSMGSWKNELSAKSLSLIEEDAAELLQTFNYQ